MPKIPKPESNQFVIWDLDNCLSNDAPRVPLIDWRKEGQARYEAYHSAAILDEPNPEAVKLFHMYEERGIIPIIFTGRPNQYRDDTDAWLTSHLRPRNPIMKVMRAKDDLRESTPLKASMLSLCIRTLIFTVDQVVAAYDDRAPIVDMYIAAGIDRACIIRANEACAYTNPLALSRAEG